MSTTFEVGDSVRVINPAFSDPFFIQMRPGAWVAEVRADGYMLAHIDEPSRKHQRYGPFTADRLALDGQRP